MFRFASTERSIAFFTLSMLLAASAPASATTFLSTSKCDSVVTCLLGENAGAGNGVEGRSAFGDGVLGRTAAPATSLQTARAGVTGRDTSSSLFNYGVFGTSHAGYGVFGSSDSGTGMLAQSRSGVALSVRSSATHVPAAVVVAGDSIALSAQASGPNAYGAYVSAGNTNANASSIGLVVSLDGGGGAALASSLVIAAGANGPQPDHFDAFTNGAGVASVDRLGDLVLAGTLHHAGTALATASGPSGARAITYGERTSAPVLDDMGEGKLVQGSAYVPLDGAFAALIAPHENYLVFVTPRGDNRGLYVTAVTQRGFAVREASGGHATIAFDYRIVATPYDTKAAHLPTVSTIAALPHHVFPTLRERSTP